MFSGQIIDLTIDQMSSHEKLKGLINEIPINIWEKQEQTGPQVWKIEKPISSYTICYEYKGKRVDLSSSVGVNYLDALSDVKKWIKIRGFQNDYP